MSETVYLGRESYPAAVVERFIAECCEVGSEHRIRAATLYREFDGWTEALGLRRWTPQRLGRRLAEIGYRAGVDQDDGRPARFRVGLRLKGELG